MTQTQEVTLTPAQFAATIALAKQYGHMWCGYQEKSLKVSDIEAYGRSCLDDNLPGGIIGPTVIQTGEDMWAVVHTTGSGRLSWEINGGGSVTLSIYRPSSLSSAGAETRRTFAYAAIASMQPPDDEGILVARIVVLNDNKRDFTERFSVDDLLIHSSNWQLSHKPDDEVKDTFIYVDPNREKDDRIYDDLLFTRHVSALIEPLVALLTANEQEPLGEEVPEDETEEAREKRWDASSARHQEWRKRVIHPAIEAAKRWLQPLFDYALPDPFDGDEAPETYWTKPGRYDETPLEVHHRGEAFPLETERAAVHAVLNLQKNPDLLLIDAVKAAIKSIYYRPEQDQ